MTMQTYSKEEVDQLTAALEQLQPYEPYAKKQALAGPDAPPMKTILDLIRYCTTVHSRFGNTCIESPSFLWGGSALNARSDKDKRIELLEAALTSINANSAPDAVSLSLPNRIKAFYLISGDALAGSCPHCQNQVAELKDVDTHCRECGRLLPKPDETIDQACDRLSGL